MKKIVLLLIALTAALWARTWEDSEAFYWEEDSDTYFYYTWFEGDSLNDTYHYSAEGAQGIYFYAGYESNDDSMGVLREYYSLDVLNDSNDSGDSVWISKYWMDDSLLEVPVVMDADVDRNDFRLLTFDSLHTEHDLWPLFDERAENVSGRSSLFLLYRKDSSYYALCLIGGDTLGCTFYLSCQFQNDGTTNFDKIPDAEDMDLSGGCLTTSLPKASRRPPAAVGFQDGVLYRVNGARSRGEASSVVIQNGPPKLKLRK